MHFHAYIANSYETTPHCNMQGSYKCGRRGPEAHIFWNFNLRSAKSIVLVIWAGIHLAPKLYPLANSLAKCIDDSWNLNVAKTALVLCNFSTCEKPEPIKTLLG